MDTGREFSRAYYKEVVWPQIASSVGDHPYLAGRLGTGSDALGLDDQQSTDHDFGCRLTLLFEQSDLVEAVEATLSERLPSTFRGLPTRFASSWDPTPRHRVDVATVDDFVTSRIGFSTRRPWTPAEWLSVPGQAFLEALHGAVFADSTTRFHELKSRFAWYPRDIWLYALAAAWRAIEQELPFVGRTADRGDAMGSRLIAARLCGHLIDVAFLLDRRWKPYPKLAGTVLTSLTTGPEIVALVNRCLQQESWRGREEALCDAVGHLVRRQEAVLFPMGVDPVIPFHARPYRVVNPALPAILLAAIEDKALRSLEVTGGTFEQWCSSVELMTSPTVRATVAQVWDAALRGADGSPVRQPSALPDKSADQRSVP